jgi:MFS transporter, DHA1 family, multidrug resistance protein
MRVESTAGAAPKNSFSEATRRRGLLAILIGNFFMWGGFFMVVPLISVHYVDDLGWAAGAIGVVLAARQLTQQGLTLFGGALADRIGAKGLICAGQIVRALGFAGLAWADSFPILLGTTMLAALGGALFEAPRAAAIAALTDESNRARFYSLSGVIGGLGMVLGPLLGALLIKFDFSLVVLAATSCYFVTFFANLALLPPVRVAAERRGMWDGVGLALHDRPFMLFNILLMGYWFMWVQITISLPLIAKDISGLSESVSWVYMLNAGMSVLLQYPLLRLVERWLRPLPILIMGMALMAIGLGNVALAQSVPALLLCVACFSAGALLATPTQQTVTADLANPSALGSYFGVNALALALGGGLGNLSGGVLYGLGQQLDTPAIPWLIFCAVGGGATLGLALIERGRERSTGSRLATPQTAQPK